MFAEVRFLIANIQGPVLQMLINAIFGLPTLQATSKLLPIRQSVRLEVAGSTTLVREGFSMLIVNHETAADMS